MTNKSMNIFFFSSLLSDSDYFMDMRKPLECQKNNYEKYVEMLMSGISPRSIQIQFIGWKAGRRFIMTSQDWGIFEALEENVRRECRKVFTSHFKD